MKAHNTKMEDTPQEENKEPVTVDSIKDSALPDVIQQKIASLTGANVPTGIQYRIEQSTLDMVTSLATLGYQVNASTIDSVVKSWAMNMRQLLLMARNT